VTNSIFIILEFEIKKKSNKFTSSQDFIYIPDFLDYEI